MTVSGVATLLAEDLIRTARDATVRRLRRRHARALLAGADPSEVALWAFGGLLLGAAAAAAAGLAPLLMAGSVLAGVLLGVTVAAAVAVDDAARRVVGVAERRLSPPAAFDLVDHLDAYEVTTLAALAADRSA